LQTGGPAADPTWAAGAGGTVTQVNSGLGLTGGPITGSGTLSLANIAVGDVLANVGGFSAAPNAVTVTDLLDFVFSNVQGSILYRGATEWDALAPSTTGYVLQTGGPAANPSWIPNEGLAAINDGDLLANTSGSSAVPVDTSLTTLLDYVFGSAQGDLLYRGASAWEVLTPSTAGYLLQTGGPAVDPSWAPPPPAGGSPYYLDPVLDVLDNYLEPVTATYYNGPGNDGIGATLTNAGTLAVFMADGDTPPVGSSILVVNMSNGAYNGIYVLNVAGDGATAWVLERRADFNQTANIFDGIWIAVFGGDSYNYLYSAWVLSSGNEPPVPYNVGTDPLYFHRTSTHSVNGFVAGDTSTLNYTNYGGGGIAAPPGTTLTLYCSSGGTIALFTDTIQLETNNIVVGAAGPAVISYAGAATNNITFGPGSQIYNIGGVAQISLSTSGVQIGSGSTVTTISTDGTFAGAVDTTLSTSLAIKTYVDSQIGGSGAVNPGLINELAYYAAAGDAVSGLATTINGILVTDGSGVPSINTTLPASISATDMILTTPDLGTPSALDATNAIGTAAGLTAGTVTTNADLTGDVTSAGNATTLTNSAVTGQALTGYSISSGTVLATDSILQAIEKIAGNTGGGGTVLSVQIFTSGAGTYTPTSGANWIWVRAVGGGGGGGGCTSGTASGGMGQSGGSGAYGEYWGAAATLSYAVGAAGSAGTAGNTGGTGGATTFGTAGAQLNLGGGVGGTATNSSSTFTGFSVVGAAGGAATTADLGIAGAPGRSGVMFQASVAFSGAGGDCAFGSGGSSSTVFGNSAASVAGTDGSGYGSGGSGGICVSTAGSAAGGAGTSGVIIITEYA
jgi:hypothetical protein